MKKAVIVITPLARTPTAYASPAPSPRSLFPVAPCGQSEHEAARPRACQKPTSRVSCWDSCVLQGPHPLQTRNTRNVPSPRDQHAPPRTPPRASTSAAASPRTSASRVAASSPTVAVRRKSDRPRPGSPRRPPGRGPRPRRARRASASTRSVTSGETSSRARTYWPTAISKNCAASRRPLFSLKASTASTNSSLCSRHTFLATRCTSDGDSGRPLLAARGGARRAPSARPACISSRASLRADTLSKTATRRRPRSPRGTSQRPRPPYCGCGGARPSREWPSTSFPRYHRRRTRA